MKLIRVNVPSDLAVYSIKNRKVSAHGPESVGLIPAGLQVD